jgi:predicted ATPase/class 3 adenylate cyclase
MSAVEAQLPSGLVTFVFTDIEGSTRLFRRFEGAYPALLDDHNRIVRNAIESHRGVVVRIEGDAFFAAFADASDALRACERMHHALAAHRWPEDTAVRVRTGIHSGDADPGHADYVALAVHQAARIVSAAHGGQTLVSGATRSLLPADAPLRALGRFRLRDFPDPEPLYQLEGPAAGTFPAPRALPAAAHNFPRSSTTFVGRDRELSELRTGLADTQLLTLVGPGGSGKTRLARELALAVLDDFPDGAWLVELASLSSGADVVPAVARALAVREAPGEELRAALLERLESARLLLVLDNCEHVLDAVSDLVDDVLGVAASVRVVATSQSRLGIGGEQLWQAAPLMVPETGSSLLQAVQCGAIQLFVERATIPRPGFSIDAGNLASVVEVCRHLDGLPLALELAAARLTALSPAQLAERLDRRFELLSGHARGAPARHQTLRATIEWSYELLAEPDRQALRRLSVFAGPFSLEGAEAVAHGETLDVIEVAAHVESLVDHSLLQLRDDGRFLMLETVREYGRLMLREADEAHEAQDRHLQWVLSTVSRRPEEGERRWYDRIEEEYEELRAALAWSVAGGDRPLGLAVLARTGSFLPNRAHTAEGRGWLDALLADTEGASPADLVSALIIKSRLAFLNGEYSIAREAAAEGLRIAEATGDASRIGSLVRHLGNVALYEGHLDDARNLYLRSLADTSQPELDALRTQLNLGLTELMLGDPDAADVQFSRSLEVAKRGHPEEVPFAQSALGMVATERRDAAGAAPLLEAAIRAHHETGNIYELAEAVEMAGAVCLFSGDAEGATWLFGASDVVYQAAGGVRPAGFFLERYQQWVNEAIAALGPASFDDIVEQGRSARVEAVVEVALARLLRVANEDSAPPLDSSVGSP